MSARRQCSSRTWQQQLHGMAWPVVIKPASPVLWPSVAKQQARAWQSRREHTTESDGARHRRALVLLGVPAGS